jgi:hypothetical protein
MCHSADGTAYTLAGKAMKARDFHDPNGMLRGKVSSQPDGYGTEALHYGLPPHWPT